MARSSEFRRAAETLERQRKRLSNLRLITGVALAVAIGWSIVEREPVAAAVAVVLAFGFTSMVRRYRVLTTAWRRAQLMQVINDRGVNRIRRDWTALPERPSDPILDDHPFANDLDLFGHASLFQLLDLSCTTFGRDRLQIWLLEPGTFEEVTERQEAVSELAPDIDWMQEVEYRGHLGTADRADTEAFLRWAEDPGGAGPPLAATWTARISVAITAIAIALSALGILSAGWFIVPVMANVALSFAVRSQIGDRVESARLHADAIRSYVNVLELLDRSTHAAVLLRELDGKLIADGERASERLNALSRMLSFAVPRGSLQHMVLQAACCWDIHLFDRLERWRTGYGVRVRTWLDVIGWYEALSSLATLRHDNPEWTFPTIQDELETLNATGLGHPLIPGECRVSNDLEVGPPGTFLFVTGSNMSGKSTLLRALGVNVVLANAGAPVCASKLELPPLSLWTSVRIVDSLEHGVSYYMAELLRLKQIVDATGAAAGSDRMVCYLLDEILSGTNTAERQIAARRFIALLLRGRTIGAVSSHDLELVDTPELRERVRQVHFTETIDRDGASPGMSFDYRLRPGPAMSTNALKLMEMVGIPLEERSQ